MKEIIAVINQKGGVGKSTTVDALGAGFTLKGHRVLYLDLDGQGNLSYSLRANANKPSVMDLLTGGVPIKETVQITERGKVIASSSMLIGADMTITQVGKEYKLKEALNEVEDEYDYIVIDTPPTLGIITINALTACTYAIIPAQADIYSLQGIQQLYDTIRVVKKHCNPFLRVDGVVLTRYNNRAIITKEIREAMTEMLNQFETRLYKTAIRESVAIKEAQAKRQDIFSYAPRGNASFDYKSLVAEIDGGSQNV